MTAAGSKAATAARFATPSGRPSSITVIRFCFAGEFVRKPAAFDEQESSAQLLQFIELMAGDEHGDAAVAIPPKPHKFKHRADWEVRAAGRTITV